MLSVVERTVEAGLPLVADIMVESTLLSLGEQRGRGVGWGRGSRKDSFEKRRVVKEIKALLVRAMVHSSRGACQGADSPLT